MAMTRSDILDLSKLEEKKAWDNLYAEGVLKEVRRFSLSLERYIDVVESLDDLADRLFGRGRGLDVEYMIEIYFMQTGKSRPATHTEYALFWNWWALDAKPIHRIQAALLAKEGV